MRRHLFLLLLVTYMAVALWVTLRPRPNPPSQPILIPLVDTWRQMRDLGDKVALQEATRNVLLFIPLGYLLPASVRELRILRRTVAFGAAMSALIELSQWLFSSGRSPSIDDVMYNTIGTAVGGCLFLLLTGLWRHRRDKELRRKLRSEAAGIVSAPEARSSPPEIRRGS
jgi:glycopeptide antibiotics resistance protein